MYETIVTAVGRVATTVSSHQFADGTPKATFRLACTERRREWTSGNWVDGDTFFVTVICWRALADNVQASLRVGDPVMVRGRMHTREYETEGRRVFTTEMDASAVGPDLARCTTVVTRPPAGGRPPAAQEQVEQRQRELVGVGAGGADGTTVDGSARSEAAARS